MSHLRRSRLAARADQPAPARRAAAAARPGAQVRVELPAHLRTLAGVGDEITVRIDSEATVRSVLDAIERDFPVLRGTIRDHVTLKRRPFLRFFACGVDLSHERVDVPLPERVAAGDEPFLVIGAIAGG